MPPSAAAPVQARTQEVPVNDWELDPRGDPDLLDSDDVEFPLIELGALHPPGSNRASRMKGPYSPDSGEYGSEMEFLDSYVVPSAQTSFAAPTPQPGRTSNQQPAPAPRERQPGGAVNASSASASAPAAAPSRKRKTPTGPPPPSRPFKRQQYVSPSRTPAEVRRIVKGEEFNLALGLPGRPYNLPKLRRPYPYMPEPMFGPPGVCSAAQNGYDAVKRHFDMAHAKWELSVSKMTSDADEMVKYGHMLRDEAHASHRWVGQIGTQTWGEDGRMKNYEPFIGALKKVEEMAEKARELVQQMEGDARRWSMEFAKKRREKAGATWKHHFFSSCPSSSLSNRHRATCYSPSFTPADPSQTSPRQHLLRSSNIQWQ